MSKIINWWKFGSAPMTRAFALLSIFLFLAAMTQPAFNVSPEIPDDALQHSFLLPIFGWLVALTGGLIEFIIWLANPLWLLSLVSLIRNRKSMVLFASLATVLAAGFFFMPSVLTNESGSRSSIVSYQSGYLLWVASMLSLFIASLIQLSNLYLAGSKKE